MSVKVRWKELFVLELCDEKLSCRKNLWGYVIGTCVKPKSINENYVAELDTSEANNSKIITLINNYVEHSIGACLTKYETTNQFLDHLQRLYILNQILQSSINWRLTYVLFNKGI